MKLKTIIQYILLSFLALLLITLLLTGWLITSQSGLRFMVNTGLKRLPALTIEQVNGRLIGPLSIKNLRYADSKIELNLNHAELDWQPSELRLSAIIVHQLTASGLDVKQLSPAEPSTQKDKPAPTLDAIIKQLQLPVTIALKKVSLNDLHYDGDFYKGQDAQDKKPPLTIEQLHFSAKSDSQKIQLDNIAFNSNLAKVDGKVKIGLARSEKTEGRIEWLLKQKNISPIKGLTQLSGNTKRLSINNDIAEPYHSEIDITIKNLIKSPSATAAIQLKKINPREINNQWPDYITDGQIELNGDLNKATFSSSLNINNKSADKPFKTLDVNTQGNWESEALNFELDAQAPALVEALNIAGTVIPKRLQEETARDAIDIQLSWQDLNKPNTQTANKQASSLYSPEGKMDLQGNSKEYAFNLQALLETTHQQKQSGQLLISGNGYQDTLGFEQITLTGPVGTLNGHGKIATKPELHADMILTGHDLNPGILAPQWPGQLNLELLVQSEIVDKNTLIQTTIRSNGTLRQHPFTLDTKGSYTKDRIDLSTLNLRSGDSTLNANLTIENQQLFANWQLVSKQLDELIPNTQGSLSSKGKIEFLPLTLGPSSTLQPIANIELKGNDIVANHQQIEKLVSDINIDWRAKETNTDKKSEKKSEKKKANFIDIKANNIVIDNTAITSASLQFKGQPEQHRIDSTIKSDKGDIELSLSGKALDLQQQARWLFSLNKATLSPKNLKPWRLKEKVNGSISREQQKLGQHCWLAPADKDQNSELCLAAEHNSGKLNATLSLSALYSDYFKPLLPENVNWADTIIKGSGTISGTINGTSSGETKGKLNSQLLLTSSPGQLQWVTPSTTTETEKKEKKEQSEQKVQSIELGAGRLSIENRNGTLNAELHLPLEQQTGLNGRITIANKKQTSLIESPLTGQLTLKLNELAPLVSFVPDASELQGSLNSEWDIGGSIKQPWLEGDLNLSNGQMRLETPNIFLENIALELQGKRQQGINYTLSAQSDGGSLEATGNIQLKEQGPEIKLQVKGNDFQALNTSDAVVYASPDLSIHSSNNTINIDGTITIPKATITPKKIPDSVVTVSEDEIIINENGQSLNSASQQLSTNIKLILGENVQVDGFGFKGKTVGTLQISKDKQGPTLGNGEIRIIDGEYRAFGQGLVIEKGIVIFSNGPINKPGIDIKALRRPAEGITVGVFARGNIAQPKLTIFSEPGMTQTEQLSWLILGRPPEQSSEGENNAINQLLLSLTLSRGDSFLNSLSDTFNLDTLSIKTGTGEAGAASDNDLAELVLGKYLSPNLYVSYGIGLFKPVNVLSLEYSLGQHWKLTSETSSESSGGDIVYTIER